MVKEKDIYNVNGDLETGQVSFNNGVGIDLVAYLVETKGKGIKMVVNKNVEGALYVLKVN